MEVFAIASIPTGAELNIEYVPELITKTRAERQEALRSSFGFSSCLCAACTAPADEVARSDARRLEIKAVSEGLRGGRGDRAATLEKLERIRVLLEEESYLGLPEFGESLRSEKVKTQTDLNCVFLPFPFLRGLVDLECVRGLRKPVRALSEDGSSGMSVVSQGAPRCRDALARRPWCVPCFFATSSRLADNLSTC